MKLHEINLLEAATGNSPDFHGYDIDEGLELLESKCSDGLKRLLKKEYFYRSDNDFRFLKSSQIWTVDPSKTERKSQNTTNQYTEILDNHAEMKDWPKRSRSYIASTSGGRASNFSGTLKVLVPYDGVKIGMVNEEDLWDTPFYVFGRNFTIQNVNNVFNALKLRTLADIKKFDQELKKNEPDALGKLDDVMDGNGISPKVIQDYKDGFFEEILKAYSPKKLGFTTGSTANLKWHNNSEVWISGPCVVLSESIVSDLIEKLGE